MVTQQGTLLMELTTGERISYLIELRGLTIAEFEERAGLSRMPSWRYRNDLNDIRAKTLCRIADALETTTDFLVGRVPDPADTREWFTGRRPG
jgi:transcriptional regulator with XRE-family HTH domain